LVRTAKYLASQDGTVSVVDAKGSGDRRVNALKIRHASHRRRPDLRQDEEHVMSAPSR
jgi:hypothetical protein